MKKISIIKNALLKQHERIDQKHLKEVYLGIKKSGFVRDPIIVDKNTKVILDGHHRYNALKMLGLSKVPAFLVDYNDESIKVKSWRVGEKITKHLVISAGLTGQLLLPRTSHHIIPELPTNSNILLTSLL